MNNLRALLALCCTVTTLDACKQSDPGGGPKPAAATPKQVAKAREQRSTALVEVAPAPAPTSAPIIGGEERDGDGYPVAHVDQAGLRSLLFHKQYQDLSRYLTEWQDRFEADPTYEVWMRDAGDAFGSAEAPLGTALDAWVAATPDSFAPYLARGTHWAGVAYARRGSNVIRDTPGADLDAMAEAIGRARTDLAKAVALRPKLVTAMSQQLQIEGLGGTLKARDAIIAKAIAVCPACFLVRAMYLHYLTPRWGGSYAAMSAFARKADVKKYPRLRRLGGYAAADAADLLSQHKDYAKALVEIDQALAIAETSTFLDERALIHVKAGDHAAALADANRALELEPGNPDLMLRRAEMEGSLKQWEAAGTDLLAGLRVDPTNWLGQRIFWWVVDGLTDAATTLDQAGKHDDALRVFDLAASLAPMDSDVQERRASAIEGKGPADLGALTANVKQHPDDFRALQALDYALARKRDFAAVIAMWTDYLARHPDDAKAHMERGGAYFNSGKRAEAKADASRACELGLTEGCAMAKHLGAGGN